MQSVETYIPRTDADGALIGLKHEVVLYDEEALVDPVEGLAQPLTPGITFAYTLPDIYDRPWARIWEECHEEGMQRPEEEDLFSFD